MTVYCKWCSDGGYIQDNTILNNFTLNISSPKLGYPCPYCERCNYCDGFAVAFNEFDTDNKICYNCNVCYCSKFITMIDPDNDDIFVFLYKDGKTILQLNSKYDNLKIVSDLHPANPKELRSYIDKHIKALIIL